MKPRLFALLGVLLFAIPVLQATAATSADLQSQIDAHNAQIQQLDQEIAQYQKQLDATSAKKQTLQTSLSQIQTSIKKTNASIQVTQNKIGSTNLQIQQLAGSISTAEDSIANEQAGLAQSLRTLSEVESQPLALTLLSEGGISGAWKDLVALTALQKAVGDHIQSLTVKKQDLASTKSAAEDKQAQLVGQQKTLKTQQGSLSVQQKSQSDLLTQTKSQEAAYQSIIAQKKAEQAAAEADIYRLSQQLAAADTTKVPTGTHGILAWPLDSIRVTQYFGKTTDSGRLYTSGTHNGVDFAASIGTPVRAALTGIVMDTNYITAAQDRKIGYCQYGSWILIKHANGLATMYAHLSGVSVSKGETVSTGQVIGYSGDTGYATGPHLHFGVYNESSISFANYKCKSGYSVHIPVAPTNGYLDPMSYLPTS